MDNELKNSSQNYYITNESNIQEDLPSELPSLSTDEIKEREYQLSSIFNNIDVGLLLQGSNSEIFLSNDQAFEMLGLTSDQLLGKSSFDPSWNVIHEDGSPFLSETHPVPEAIRTKQPVKEVIMGVYRPVTKDRIWLLVSAIPVLKEDSSIKHVICSFIDISKRKAAEFELQKSHKKISILYEVYKNTTENLNLKDLLNSSLSTIKDAFLIDGIAIYTINETDKTLTAQSFIGITEELITIIRDYLKEESLTWRAIITKRPQFSHTLTYADERFKTILLKEGFHSVASFPMIIGEKTLGAITIAFNKNKSFDNDEIQLIMTVCRQLGIAIQNAQLVDSLKLELVERTNLQAEMKKTNELINEKNIQLNKIMKTLEIESKVDPLTGLYNRRYILNRINEDLSALNTNDNNFSIIITDIDFFKKINDTYGHAFGDYVLKTVSDILKAMVGEAGCVSRWGGEEFLIFLSGSNLKEARIIAEKIRKKVEETSFGYDSNQISLTMTFGVAIYNKNESIDDMIKKADDSLYLGKNSGRNQVI
jgi:diguanylate cyclase (GGDEF)-like protein/PAS domain S-box-containing protein